MSEIVKTRIIPKKPVEFIVNRKRLIDLIKNNISKNLILIISPAGFGKTTLVLDFFFQTKIKYAWLYLATDVNSFRSFMQYLVHSLAELNKTFGTRTLELLNSMIESKVLSEDETNSINALIGTFSNEFLGCFKEDVYLVIDDMHNAGNNKWLHSTFNSLMEDFPQNLHIFITSRALPDFNFSRFAAKRNMLKIDSGDLNFNLEETEQLLKEIYKVECSYNELKLLDSKLEGWITGLHLILQAYGKNFITVIDKKEIEENIFLYFAEEIFKSLDEKIKEFLLLTSMVDSFSEDLCKSVPGIESPADIISNLKKKNIFLESSPEETLEGGMRYLYSYHNLFKQFLNKKLKELKTGEEIEQIAGHIFNYYLKAGDIVNAIEFSLRAKDYQNAAGLITRAFDVLFAGGRYEQLDKWIDSFPANFMEKNAQLKFYKGLLLKVYTVDLDNALKLIEDAAKEEKKESVLYILAKIEAADIMLVKNKPKESISSLNELLELTRDVSLKVRVSISLAKAYYSLGSKYYDEIIKILDNTLELCNDNDIRDYHSEIYSLYGKVYQNRGEFAKSLQYYKNVLQLEKNVFRRFQAITNIILLYSWSGEYIKAKEYLDKADEIYKKFHAEAFNRSMLRIIALFKFEAGDYEDSINTFSDLIVLDTKNNITSYLFLFYLFICEAFVLLNKHERGAEFLSLAEKSKETHEEFRNILINYHKAILSKPGTASPNPERSLLNAANFFEEQGLEYSKAQVEFHLADYYFKTGKVQTSLKYLKDSLDTSSQKQFNSFLIQHFISKRYLFDFAIANKLHENFINDLLSKVFERESYTWLSEDCKKRIKSENKFLYDVTLNTLGRVELFIRGIPVSEDKWIRKKSKLLLIYLLLHKDQKHTKDKVLELFFGDLSAASAENVFHQAITNIRNIVKPDTPADKDITPKKSKKDKQNLIIEPDSLIQYEDKVLGILNSFNIKTDSNDFLLLVNRIRSPETSSEMKIDLAKDAVKIYKGQFLPGYYEDWIEDMRINLQNKFEEICVELIETLNKNSEYNDVIYYGEKLILEDKLHEEGFTRIIEAYTKTGNPNMARKKFSQLLKNYEEELGEKPAKHVLDRIQSILLTE